MAANYYGNLYYPYQQAYPGYGNGMVPIVPMQQFPQYSQQSQAPAPQPQNGNAQSNIVWIKGGDDEAKMYPVAPNTAVALWSETDPVVYLKQADASGKPTLKIFDLVERKEAVSEEPALIYASKDDVASLIGAVKQLTDNITVMKDQFDQTAAAMREEIDAMKGDMYGIAGKKKTTVRKDDNG